MKTTTKIIRIKTDFDYGINNGLRYVGLVIQFGSFAEIIRLTMQFNRFWYFILLPVGLACTWIWGRFLRKKEFRRREAEFISQENTYLMKIFDKTTKDENDS